MVGHEAEEQRVRGARSSAHSKAYEAAFTSIYWRELGSVRARQAVRTSGQEKTAAARSPHDMAMRLARLQVGAPVPRMEQQYRIEALLETIKIRSRLATFARTFEERAGQMVASQLSDRHRKAFGVAGASFERLATELQIMNAVLETHWGKRLDCAYVRLADVRRRRKILSGTSCISRTPAPH